MVGVVRMVGEVGWQMIRVTPKNLVSVEGFPQSRGKSCFLWKFLWLGLYSFGSSRKVGGLGGGELKESIHPWGRWGSSGSLGLWGRWGC